VQCERLFAFPCSGYPPPFRQVLPPKRDYVSGLRGRMQSLKTHIRTYIYSTYIDICIYIYIHVYVHV
jgi:hypothetical protein